MSPIVGVWANPLLRNTPRNSMSVVMFRIQVEIGAFDMPCRIQKGLNPLQL